MGMFDKIADAVSSLTETTDHNSRSPIKVKSVIKQLEQNSLDARDKMFDDIMRRSPVHGSTVGGMQGFIKSCYLDYTPRHWEKSHGELSLDEDHLVFPYLFSNINAILSVVVPSNIKYTAIPLSGDKKLFASQATAILDEEMEYLGLKLLIKKIVLGAICRGSQIIYAGTSKQRGALDTERFVELCDPLAVLWDPAATTIEECRYVIYKRWRPISDVVSEYEPSFKVEDECIDEKYSSLLTLSPSGKDGFYGEGRCVETIIHMRDNATKKVKFKQDVPFVMDGVEVGVTEEPIINPRTGRQEIGDSQIYPYGRRIVMINDKVLDQYDEPNPDNHRKCPFLKLDYHSYPGMFWGMPEGYVNGDIQRMVDETISTITRDMRDSVTYTAFKQGAFETDLTTLTTDSTIPIRMKDGVRESDAFLRIPVGQVNENAHSVLQTVVQLGQRFTMSDSFMGMSEPGVTSGKQQKLLSDDSEKKTLTFSGQIDDMLQKLGYIILHNAVQYRFAGDTIEIANIVTGKADSFNIDEFKSNFMKDVEFRVKIVPNSGLPSDRQERARIVGEMIERVTALYAANPAIARLYVSMQDIPEADEIINVLDQTFQQQQQIQATMLAQQAEAVPITQNTGQDNEQSSQQ